MHAISTEKAPAAIGPYSQGVDFDHVIKTTCFLDDISDFAAFNEVYAQSFGKHLPARSAVGVDALPKGALIEVEVIASVE